MCIDSKDRIITLSDEYYDLFRQPKLSLCDYVRDKDIVDELVDWYDSKDLSEKRNREDLLQLMKTLLEEDMIDDDKVARAVKMFRRNCKQEVDQIPEKFSPIRPAVYKDCILCALGMMIIEYGTSIKRIP